MEDDDQFQVKAVVLAGGSGSRLWPLSREKIPKQFLNLNGKESMLEATIGRIQPFCSADDVIVVSSEQHVHGEAYHALQPYQVISEPIGRNTAPAIALAAVYLRRQAPSEDPIMLVLPADHIIQNVETFHRAINQAVKAASQGYLVTFGIQPSHPDTGLGYIKSSIKDSPSLAENTLLVDCFKEKPNLETAQKYLAEGGYFWNSGMFVWRASVILDAIKQCLPEVNAVMNKIIAAHEKGESFQMAVNRHFGQMPAISIDYGVLEKIAHSFNKLVVVPCDIEWNDVGSWDAVHEISKKDGSGNATQGNVLALDCKNTLLQSHHRLIAAVGVEDVCLIETPDAILLTKRGETQRVREVVDELKKKNAQEHIFHLTVRRPWGSYTVLEEQSGFKMKRITVNPGAALSLQRHQHRSEHWIVVSGTATVTCDDRVTTVAKNQSTYIPVGGKHRLENRGKMDLQLIEVQVGDYLEEDDIERFDDVYGRS